MIKVTQLAFKLNMSAKELNKIGSRLGCKKVINRKGEEFYSRKYSRKIIKHFITAAQLNVGAVFLLDVLDKKQIT